MVIILVLCSFVIYAQQSVPKVFTIDANKIASLKNRVLSGEMKKDSGIKKIFSSAEKLLNMKPVSIVEKDFIPPSGDKHDYASMGKYWWPNPNTPDGVPYIRKDGEVNPEASSIPDNTNFGKIISSVEMLSMVGYISNEQKYSTKAVELLKVWFINKESRMNPNLNYAQFVKGSNDGRGAGIIDIHAIYRLIDAIGLLTTSTVWNNEIDKEIKSWFEEYLNWLMTSKNGKNESVAKNNHGSWYHVQVVTISMFLDKKEFTRQLLLEEYKRRIDTQIKKDGSQPLELVRTKSWHYSVFNTEALMRLALLGDRLGIDLWNYKNEEGASIRTALDYVLPAALDHKLWNHPQIEEIKTDEIYKCLLLAKSKLDKKIYSEWIDKIFNNKKVDFITDLY